MGSETGLNMWAAVEKLDGRVGLVRCGGPESPTRRVSAGCVRMSVWFSRDCAERKNWSYSLTGSEWLPKKPEPCDDPETVIGWMLQTKRAVVDQDGDTIYWSTVGKRFAYKACTDRETGLDTETIAYPCVPADGKDW